MRHILGRFCAHAALLIASTCLAEAPATQPSQQVAIDNFSFSPAKLTVEQGTKVVWVNHDDVPHTVTSTTKPREVNSGALDTDAMYSHVFDHAGTYSYYCTVHPHMTGEIIVTPTN